jgi:hypothetical protein
MDPNATLRAIADTTDTDERAELCEALSGWIQRGGFAPDWSDPNAHNGAALFRLWANAQAY